jgi:hypothetical protein
VSHVTNRRHMLESACGRLILVFRVSNIGCVMRYGGVSYPTPTRRTAVLDKKKRRFLYVKSMQISRLDIQSDLAVLGLRPSPFVGHQGITPVPSFMTHCERPCPITGQWGDRFFAYCMLYMDIQRARDRSHPASLGS